MSNFQNDACNLRRVFNTLVKVFQHCRSRSLNVPPLTLRFLTQARMSVLLSMLIKLSRLVG